MVDYISAQDDALHQCVQTSLICRRSDPSLDPFAKRRQMPAICATGTAGVDVKRTLRIAPVGVAIGQIPDLVGQPFFSPLPPFAVILVG